MQQNFQGEHLWIGQLGHLFVIITFVFSALSVFSYWRAFRSKTQSVQWKRLGYLSTGVFSLSTIGVGILLFFVILNHYFEYYYAWAHSSIELPVYYMISCFWEGQEGSFWLWMFWQVVILCWLFRKRKSTSPLVFFIISFSHLFLSSMLLGIDVMGFKWGSSPFILLRNAIEGPIFSQPNYLELIKNGKGLNPLLQSYWMVIHPPFLFLGFAAMIVPFARLFSGVWNHNLQEEFQPIKQWLLFSVAALGIGILLGSFWAFEALNFGGYWAWDPVENASLVPWIIAVVALHLLLIYKKSQHYPFLTSLFIGLTFIFVLYASYLTRSGVLGNSSAHSFTDLGLNGQLLFYLFFFIFVLGITLWKAKKDLVHVEEETFSREFWMFAGSLFLALSSLQIIASTSLPVFNKLFGTSLAPPEHVVQYYNQWQFVFASFILIFMGLGMLSRFKKQSPGLLLKKLTPYAVLALLASLASAWLLDFNQAYFFLLLVFAAFFSLFIHLYMLIVPFIHLPKAKISTASVSHFGFALMILGIVVSGLKQKILSVNIMGYDYGEDFKKGNDPGENILLFKNEPYKMGDFILTYQGDSVSLPDRYYSIKFNKMKEKQKESSFILKPKAQNNPQMGLIASPDIHRTFFDNLYIHVSMVPIVDEEHAKKEVLYSNPYTFTMSLGETIQMGQQKVTLKKLEATQDIKNIKLGDKDEVLNLEFAIQFIDGTTHLFSPKVLYYKGNYINIKNVFDYLDWKFEVFNFSEKDNKIEFLIYPPRSDQKKYIVLKAILFPFINLYWVGALLMMFGVGMGMFKRYKGKKN